MRYGSAWGSSGKYSPVFISFRDYTKDVVSNGKLFTIKFKVKSSIPNEGVKVEVVPHDNSNFTYKNLNKNWDGFVTSNNRFYENMKYKTLGITLNRSSEFVSIDKNYESDMTVKASSVEYFKSFGEDCISVSFNIMNNVGMSSLMLRVEFDETYLEVLDVFNGNVFSRGCLDWGNISWYFDSNVENRLLVFEGKGFMPDCLESDTHPWSVWSFEGDCGLVLKGNIEVVGEYCFCNDSNIKDIYIGKSIKTIKRGAFKNTGIKDIIIPENVYEVREEALIVKNGLEGLWKLKESTRLESGSYVLKSGASIRGCKVKMSLGSDCDIYGDGESLYIFGVGSTVNHYETLEYSEWNSVISGYETIVVGAEIDALGSLLFDGMYSLKCVKAIGTELKVIESKTFNSCKNLESLINFDFVEYIGSKAFDNTKIVNKDSEVIIGRCLYYCGNGFNKSSYYVDENIVQICYNAFKDKECLVLIDFKNVRRIENFAFERCRGLKKIVISDGVYHVGAESFKDCTSAMDIVIGSNANAETYALGYEYIQNFRKLSDLRIFVMRGSKIIEYLEKWGFEYTIIDKYVFSIKFIADGIIVYETTFGVLDLELDYIPEVPEKDMYFCSWEDFTLRPEDIVVNAIYVAMNPADFLIYEDLGTYSRVIGMSRDCVGVLNVPEYHNGLPVRELGDGAFKSRSLEVVNLPKTVNKVGNECFYYCRNLHTVSGFDKVESIGERAFTCSGIKSFVLSGDVLKSIGTSAFYDCNELVYVYLGNGLVSLPAYLFFGCEYLQNFTIPENVQILPDYIFYGCSSLSSIELGGVVSVGTYSFSGCKSLTTLGDCSSVETIGSYAFQGCNVREIYFPKVSYLYSCFIDCVNLRKAEFGDSILEGTYAFQNCVLLETFIGKIRVAGIGFFSGCVTLKNIDFSYITDINSNAFYNCKSLTGEIEMPQITKIVDMYGCTGIESLVLGSDVSTQDISVAGLRGCSSLKSVYIKTEGNATISSTAKKITSSKYEFIGCFQNNTSLNILNINIQGKLVLGVNSLYGCVGLISLVFNVGSGDNTISKSCFEGCISLKSVVLHGSFSLADRAFYNCSSLKTADLSGVTSIGSDCFFKDISLESVILGTTLDIGDSAFHSCSSLKSVYNKNFVKDLGTAAFFNCTSLEDFDLRGVTAVRDSAFRGCTSLKSLTADSSLEIVGDYAFASSGLVYINLSNSQVVKLGAYMKNYGYVFSNCLNLEEVLLPATLTDIHGYCFEYCNSLKSVILPGSVVYIGRYCFAYSGIESCVIGKNVETVETNAFLECQNLKTLEIKSVYLLSLASYNEYPQYIKNPYFTTLKLSANKSSGYYIERLMFRDCSNLRYIEGLNKVNYIEKNAFRESPVELDSWSPRSSGVSLGTGCFLNAYHSGVLKFTNYRVSMWYAEDGPVFGPGVSKVYIGPTTDAHCSYSVGASFHPDTRIVAHNGANELFIGLKTSNTLVYQGSISKVGSSGKEDRFTWHLLLEEDDAVKWLNLDGSEFNNCADCHLGSSLFILDGNGTSFNNLNKVKVWSAENIGSSYCLLDYYASKVRNTNTNSMLYEETASLLVLRNSYNTNTTIPRNAFQDMLGIKILYDNDFDENDSNNMIYYESDGVNYFLGAGYVSGDISKMPKYDFLSLGIDSFKNTYCYQIKDLIKKTNHFGDYCLYSEGIYNEYNSPCDEEGVLHFSSYLAEIGNCSLKGFVGVKKATLDDGKTSGIYTTIEDGLIYRNALNKNFKKLIYVPDSWGSAGCSVLLGTYDNPCDFVGGVFSVNKNIRFITVASDKVEVSRNKLLGNMGSSVLKSRVLAFEKSFVDISPLKNDNNFEVIINGRHLVEGDDTTPLWSLYIHTNKSESYLKIESVGDNNITPDYSNEYSNLALLLNGVTENGPNLTAKIDKVRFYINNGKREWTFGSYFWYDMRVVNSTVSDKEVSFDDICEFYVKNASGNYDLVRSLDMALTLNNYSMAGLALRRNGSRISGIELGACEFEYGHYTEPFRTVINLGKTLIDTFSGEEITVPWSVDINNFDLETYGSFYVSFVSGVSSDDVIYAYGSIQNGYAEYRTISTLSQNTESVIATAHTLVCWKSGTALVVGVPSIFEESSNGRKTSSILMFRGNKIKPNDYLVISSNGNTASMADASNGYPDWDSGVLVKSSGGYGNIIIDSKIQTVGMYCFHNFYFEGLLFKEVVADNGGVVGCNTIKTGAFDVSSMTKAHVLSGNLKMPKSLSSLDIHAFLGMPESGLNIWVYPGAVVYRYKYSDGTYTPINITWWTTEINNFSSDYSKLVFNVFGSNKSRNICGIRVKDSDSAGVYMYLKKRFVHDNEATDPFDSDNYWKTMTINGYVKVGAGNTVGEWDTYLNVSSGNYRILATDLEWQEMEASEEERWSDYL